MALAWACFGERGDPPAMNTPEGPELIEQGEVFDRPYEQRQRFPGDAEAVEGMGPHHRARRGSTWPRATRASR